MWAVAAALPLAIPSYVAALALLGTLGPGGALSQALPRAGAVDITGFPGAALALTLSTYPYARDLPADRRGALRRADPALEEAARGLDGARPAAVLFGASLPLARPALGREPLLPRSTPSPTSGSYR